MPNWKRVVVGDAFRIPSREINYYRDLFLLWPFLLFSIAGLIHVFTPDHYHRVLGAKCLALAVLAIVLARERLVLFLGALGFCALRFLGALFISRDWRILVGLLATGIPLLLSFRFWGNHKLSYEWPKGLSVVDLIVGLSSLGLTFAIFSWIRG